MTRGKLRRSLNCCRSFREHINFMQAIMPSEVYKWTIISRKLHQNRTFFLRFEHIRSIISHLFCFSESNCSSFIFRILIISIYIRHLAIKTEMHINLTVLCSILIAANVGIAAPVAAPLAKPAPTPEPAPVRTWISRDNSIKINIRSTNSFLGMGGSDPSSERSSQKSGQASWKIPLESKRNYR